MKHPQLEKTFAKITKIRKRFLKRKIISIEMFFDEF